MNSSHQKVIMLYGGMDDKPQIGIERASMSLMKGENEEQPIYTDYDLMVMENNEDTESESDEEEDEEGDEKKGEEVENDENESNTKYANYVCSKKTGEPMTDKRVQSGECIYPFKMANKV